MSKVGELFGSLAMLLPPVVSAPLQIAIPIADTIAGNISAAQKAKKAKEERNKMILIIGGGIAVVVTGIVVAISSNSKPKRK